MGKEADDGVAHDGAIITPQYAFGLNSTTTSNVWHLDGERILYTVGLQAAVYDKSTDEMRFIQTHAAARCLRALTVSRNLKYFAVVEDVEGSDAHQVSVYSLHSDKRVKTLTLDPQYTAATTITAISFSESSKLLLTLTAEPDWTLLLWRWYSNKVVGVTRLDAETHFASFSPVDDLLFVALGPRWSAQYRLDLEADAIRASTSVEPDPEHGVSTTLCWLTGGLLAIATDRGVINILQDAQCRQTLLTADAPATATSARATATNGGGRDGQPSTGGAAGTAEAAAGAEVAVANGDHLTVLVAKTRGFLAAGHRGLLYIFEPPDGGKRDGSSRELFQCQRVVSANLPGRHVMWGSLNGGEEQLVVTTSAGELLFLNFTAVQELDDRGAAPAGEEQENGLFTLLSGGFHSRPVVGLDIAATAPLLAAAASDRSVRVWNWQTHQLVVRRVLPDDVLSCALHPAGTLLLLGMHDKLRMYHVAQDELECRVDFPVAKCHLVRFSHGGATFAAVGRSHVIYVFRSFGGEPVATFKAHVSAVTDLSFSLDESTLVSCGAGGAVYFWNLCTGARHDDWDYVDKKFRFSSIVFHDASRGAVVRTSDGRLLHVASGSLQYEGTQPVPPEAASEQAATALVGRGRVVLAADDHGCVVALGWPRDVPPVPGFHLNIGAPAKYRLHAFLTRLAGAASSSAGGIMRMVACEQRGLLFTASADGVVMMSRLQVVLGGTLLSLNPEAIIPLPNLVVMPEERLAALKDKVGELAGTIATVKSDADYQFFRQTQALRDAITRLEAEAKTTRAELLSRTQDLERMKAAAEQREKTIIKELEMAHMGAAEELEALYERRLELEALKQQELVGRCDDTRYHASEDTRRMADRHAAEIAKLHEHYRIKLEQAEERVEAAKAAHAATEKYFEQFAHQAEEDYEEQVDRLNTRMSSAVEEASDGIDKLKTTNHILKRTNLRLKGDKATSLKKVEKLTLDNESLREQLDDVAITVDKLRHEVEERDTVLADNYQIVQALRRQIQDLEKHKFVLTSKVDTHAKMIAPHAAEVTGLQTKLKEHDKELASYVARIADATKLVAEKDTVLRSMRAEAATAKSRLHRQAGLLHMFSHDVFQVMQASNERIGNSANAKTALELAVAELYEKYTLGDGQQLRSDAEVEAELMRQLHNAELRTALLSNKIEKERRVTAAERQVAVRDNATLLQEMGQLRRTQRETHDKLQEALLVVTELNTRYRMLEMRVGGKGAAATAGPPAGDESTISEGGVFSLAGRVAPSRPSSSHVAAAAVASNHRSSSRPSTASRALKASSSRPRTANGASAAIRGSGDRPASAGFGMYRAAGVAAPSSSAVVRGSPARVLQELVGTERDRISALLSQLRESDVQVKSQAEQIRMLQSAVGDGLDEVAEDDEEAEDDEAEEMLYQATNDRAGSIARALTRPQTARPTSPGRISSSSPLGSGGPISLGSLPRSRPTTAGGMGMRAFVDSNLENWRFPSRG